MGSPSSSLASRAMSSHAGPAIPFTCRSSFPVVRSMVNSISGTVGAPFSASRPAALRAGRRSGSIADTDLDHVGLDRAVGGAAQAALHLPDHALAVGGAQPHEELPTAERLGVELGHDRHIPARRARESQVVGGAADVLTADHDLGRLGAPVALVP